jgi:hypothetical protein
MPEETPMFDKILVAGFCIAALIAILFAVRRRQGAPRGRRAGTRVPGSSTGTSLFGLAPGDAAQFRTSAREQMQHDQAQWGRDYVPGMSDGATPGRIAGIPRTLRVRH